MTNDQSTPIPGAGHDYVKLANETVNPANGSVSIRIGAPVPPGRRLTLPFSFDYDTNGVQHPSSGGNGNVGWLSNTSFLSEGGWAYSVPLVSMVPTSVSQNISGHQYTCYYYIDYMFADPSGGRHALGLSEWEATGGNQCQNLSPAPQVYPRGSTDQYQAITQSSNPAPVLVADRDGTVYEFPNVAGYHGTQGAETALPSVVEDRNGNQIAITDSGNGAFTATDTLGRAAIQSSGFGAGGNTVAISGLGDYTVEWGTATYSYSVGAQQQVSDPGCAFSNPSGSLHVITSITLPNDESYTFSYDPTYGLISQITYPSGGWVKYTWEVNAQSEFGAFTDSTGAAEACEYTYGAPAVAERQVSFDGSTVALTQTFSYATTLSTRGWSQKTATVTTTDNLRNSTYTTSYAYAPVSVPIPPNVTSYFGEQVPVETQVIYKDWSGSTLSTVTKAWQNQYLMTQQRITPYGGGAAEKDFTYGNLDLLTDEKDYGYASTPPGALLKETSITYWTPATSPIFGFSGGTYYQTVMDRPSKVVICGATPCSSSQNRVAETDYGFDGSGLTGTSGVVNHDYTNYPSSYTNRGNASSMSKWASTSGGSLAWTYTYDDTGQELRMSDPDSHGTSYSYTDEFPACGSPTGSTNAYLTEITDAKGFTQSFNYRYCDGQLNSATDWNGQTTSYAYSDSLARLTQINYPDGGQTAYSYTSICGNPTSTSILLQGGTDYTESATMDGVCHVTRTAVTSDPAGTDYTDTTYDGSGRVWKASNPYRSTSDTSYGVTTSTYDAFGRTTSVAYPDASTATTSYSASSTTSIQTVVDAAGKKRTLVSDGLARLTKVTEDPSGLDYSTTYAYGPLGNLGTVTQGGQTRSFTYDGLSRMLTTANPESGTTTYTYPVSGSICSGDPSDVCTRKDARSITTTYAYDALNRVTSKAYSDGTPTAAFAYDETTVTIGSCTSPTLQFPIGRLTHTTTGSAGSYLTATVQDYDPMGRTRDYWQATPLNCGSSLWFASYTYDKAGDVTSWLHPAGFVINQTINGAREISQITSSLSDATHPASLATITYSPFGSVSTLQNGCVGTGCTNRRETYFYNNRMQMAVAELGLSTSHPADFCRVYSYYVGANASACSESPSGWPTGTTNNGNVGGYYYSDNMFSGLNHTAAYTYDGVNRLATAAATGSVAYSQTYTSGQLGNMNCTPAGPGCVSFTYNTSTNRITTAGYSYDAAGDVIGDGTNTYTWDAEARLTKVVNGAGTAISTNTYNALGQRVRDVTTSATTDEAYGAGGELLWRYTGNSSTNRSFVSFSGGIVAEYYSGGTLFDHPEELGSIAASTAYNGTACQERLFYPYGELWTGAGSCGMHQEFAKLPDYDAETDQYNTLNRHYTPMGRWMSPDPGGEKVVKLDDPQTWNMYAYVRNNPTTLTDPSGLCGHPGEGPCVGATGFSGDMPVDGVVSDNTPVPSSVPDPPENTALQQNTAGMKAETAAVNLTRESIRNGHPAEYGGYIIKSNGKITFTKPIRGGNGSFDPTKVHVPKGAAIVGMYHTHPESSAKEGEGPSPQDIYYLRTTNRASWVGYVAGSYSGVVYRYTQSEPVKGYFDTGIYGTKIGVVPCPASNGGTCQ